MTTQVNATVDCQLVAEYVDEGEGPAPAAREGQVVRPKVVADYHDFWGRDDGTKEFTVLLKDGRVIAVRGQSLKYEPHS